MRFQRISDNSIRCIISPEEMNERGVELDELMSDRAKAENFLRDILSEAKAEVDFSTTGYGVNVQAMVMPDGNLSLTISDEPNMDLKKVLGLLKDKLNDLQQAVEMNNESCDQIRQEVKDAHEIVKEQLKTPLWAEAYTLDQCIDLAKQIPNANEVESDLYKYNGSYFLKMNFDGLEKEVSVAVLVLSEYANGLWADSEGCAMIFEHGEVIISKNALGALAEL